MDDLLKQMFPEGEERWLKVKYLNSEKAIKSIRFNTPDFNNDDLGFEFTAIGTVAEYMPQVEALLEIKVEISRDVAFYNVPRAVDVFNEHIDRKIHEVLNKVILTK